MALEFGTDDRAQPRPAHEIGADLSLMSVHELDERIDALRAEIERLQAARDAKEASKRAADSFFKA